MSLVSCAPKKAEPTESFKLYYVNNEETKVLSVDYEIKSSPTDTEGILDEIFNMLETMPERRQYEAPLAGGVDILGYTLADKLLTLNFAGTYYDIPKTVEILDRAAVVRTFIQLDAVEYVSFMVEDTPLVDHYGNIIGNMSADTFIDNMGHEINTYEKVELKLYFANETGDKLLPVYRSVVYNSNISMERLVVEQIVKGPNSDICYPTVSSASKINSVNVKDGVCYIDFDTAFLQNNNQVTPSVCLYSIVNTLTELPDINKVAISVNGEASFTYMDMAISGPYERNLDLIE